jgi:acetyl esterase/lipase
MTKYLLLCCLLTTVAGASLGGPVPPQIVGNLVMAGLVGEGSDAPSDNPAPTPSPAPAPDQPQAPAQPQACADVEFSRNLKYGESDQNVLDVATGKSETTSPRPVLLFVAGESFVGETETTGLAASLQDAAMCFAARNGMVGVKVNYRLAPANPWPAGAKDVAAATSWVHDNIDLFGGSPDEIVAVGYSEAGASHVASFLGHPEFQVHDSDVAGAVLVSGIYRPAADAGEAEKSYFGADASKYDERSAFPGILNIETPLLLAWSAVDPPRLVAQGEKLKELLCNSATHCPHTTVLRNRDSLASVFDGDVPGGSLAEPTLELVREIEARGLP